MRAWMLEAGTWKLKSKPGNGILEPRSQKSEPGSWKTCPGMRTPGPGYTKTPAAPGLARGTCGPNILIDVRRQGVADQVYA